MMRFWGIVFVVASSVNVIYGLAGSNDSFLSGKPRTDTETYATIVVLIVGLVMIYFSRDVNKRKNSSFCWRGN